jgi:RHS repeat-associated protein
VAAQAPAAGPAQFLSDDGQGNLTTITTTNAALACSVRYDPWGTPLGAQSPANPCDAGSTINDHFYRGQRLDPVTGSYQLGNRTYQPSKASFLNPDTYRTAPPEKDLSVQADPLTQNRYSYVNGDPVNLVDPDGHKLCRPNDPSDFCDAYRGNPMTPPEVQHLIDVHPPRKSNPDLPRFQRHTVASIHGSGQWCTYGDKRVDCDSYLQYIQYADDVVKYAEEAGVDPVFLMAILLNERKPLADFPRRKDRGVGSMSSETFTQAEEYAAQHHIKFSGDWNKSASDPALSIEATAWKLRQLQDTPGRNYTGTRKQDETIAAEYNGVYGALGEPGWTHGGRPLDAIPFADRVPAIPFIGNFIGNRLGLHDGRLPFMGGKGWAYVRNLNENWPEASQLICQSGAYACHQ